LAPASGEVSPLALTEYRVLIFNSANTLEVDTFKTLAQDDSLLTVSLISGPKKIFVLVNGGTDVANLSTPAKGTGFNNYSQFNGIYDFTTALTNLNLLYGSNGSKFIYSSNVKDAPATLVPGVSALESQDENNQNYLKITVDRLIAKVALTKQVPSGPDGLAMTGTLADKIITKDSSGYIEPATVRYRVWNINKGVYPFQNYDASNVLQTPYASLAPPHTAYYAIEQGQATSPYYISIATRTGNPTNAQYYYVTENVPSVPYGTNTTRAEVQAVYRPIAGTYVSATIGYNEATSTFAPVAATTDLSTASDMYLFNEEGILGFPIGTLLAGPDAFKLARKVVYHMLNPSIPPNNSLDFTDYAAITQTQVETYFLKYTNGLAYYSLYFGEQSAPGSDDINFGVKRNYYYDAYVTGFKTLGSNVPDNDPGILSGRTNITIHIYIRDWTGKIIEKDI
jgi:hypothetical protein